MQTQTKLQIIAWIKYTFNTIAIALWLYMIITIAQRPTPFIEQAPYCMLSTMVVFGVLSTIHKGIYHWSLRHKKD